VTHPNDLNDVLEGPWAEVLEHVAEAVLVLDSKRVLRFVNERARRLFGYEEDQPIGGRCKLTTQGIDCENACPLTFALDRDMDRVDGFSTVYHTRDGRAVPLKVTVIPLKSQDGEFKGALEILRPTEPDHGFVLAGRGESSQVLHQRVRDAARSTEHVVLTGEAPACADVASAIHRLSGLADSLFHVWTGSWSEITAWPPGTMFAPSTDLEEMLAAGPPEGWRVIVGGEGARTETDAGDPPTCQRIDVPTPAELDDDLPLIMAAWLNQLAPELAVHPRALERLSRMAKELGFEGLQPVLYGAVAAADGQLDESHLPRDGYRTAYLDELLAQDDPLSALERRLIYEVLERNSWRMQDAADRLGISRVTLWRKMKDHGIERPRNDT
jgi:PAS domain S-box-containing protein